MALDYFIMDRRLAKTSHTALPKKPSAVFQATRKHKKECGSGWQGQHRCLVLLGLLGMALGCVAPFSSSAGDRHVPISPFDARIATPIQITGTHQIALADVGEEPGQESYSQPSQGRFKSDPRPRILLRPFAVDAERPDDTHLGYVMVEAVMQDLSQVASVIVIPGSVLNRLFLGRQETLLQLTGSPDAAKAETWCREAHADLVVTGSVKRSASGVTATLRLMRSEQTQWLAERSFSGTDFFDVANKVVLCVLDHCGTVPSDRGREIIKCRPTTVLAAYEEIGKADRAQEEGRMFKALGYCKKATALDPEFAFAHAKLGQIYMDQGQFDLAIAALKKASEIDPSIYDRSNLAMAYRKSGRAEKAFAEYAEVLKLRPHDPYIHVQLGSGHSYEKNWEQAEKAFNDALRLDPLVPGGRFSLGLVFRHSGRLGQAAAEFRKATEDYPGDIQAYVMLATVHALLGNASAAISALEEGLKVSPEYGKAHNNLAAYYGGTRQWDKAWKHVHEAQRLRYPVADVILDTLREYSVEPKDD